jgi:hypothetical protein
MVPSSRVAKWVVVTALDVVAGWEVAGRLLGACNGIVGEEKAHTQVVSKQAKGKAACLLQCG